MRKLVWESFSFVLGIHSYHEYQRGGNVFSFDQGNLRADQNGYLRQRQGVSSLREIDATGIASTLTHYFHVDVNGNLWAVSLDDDSRRAVSGISGLSGKVWIVSEFRNFLIVSSEGDDKGFWIDMREDSDTFMTGYNLGIDPPESTFTRQYESGLVDFLTLDVGQTYVFRMTYLRNFAKPSDILDGIPSADPELFEGAESVFSPPHVVIIRGSGDPVDKPTNIVDDDGNSVDVIESGGGTSVRFHRLEHSIDPQVTGITLYQAVIPARTRTDIGDRINIDKLVYRLVDFVPRTATVDVELRARSDERWAEAPQYVSGNDRLPAEPAQITYYNDLVVAAVSNELRYSDFRDGSPVQWAYPEANSILAHGEVFFCVEYRGVLLFGGPRGIWRLTGVDEINFDRDNISAVGPVTRGAFGVFEDGIGFIAGGGFYMTNGVDVEKISTPALDAFFEENSIAGGSVILLPNNDRLWVVEFADGTKRQFVLSARSGWFGWDGIEGNQFTAYKSGSGDHITYASEDGVFELLWNDFSVDRELPWFWESNVIDFKHSGDAEALKLFRWLEVSSEHSGEGLLEVWVDGDLTETEFEFRGNAQRPVRVKINRRGEKIRFKISGTGEVIIRYLRLVADTRSRRTRF